MGEQSKVCIIGSGNWGSAIARIVGANAKKGDEFNSTVNMWVFEEMIDGQKLTEIINTTHENVKYLKGYKLPENVIAVPDITDAIKDANVLVFVLPHQFVPKICKQMKGKIAPGAYAISLIKGLMSTEGDAGIELISKYINRELDIPVSVLMGANLAPEVAAGNFCETTIGCTDEVQGPTLKKLFQSESFRVVVVGDSTAVELCGALKNIVAVGAGICDGLSLGDNTKAAIIRLGLMEMMAFAKEFYEGVKTETFMESCGIADLVTTCYGGRNRRIAEAFVKTGKSIEELEKEMLNGQKLQGPQTAHEVHFMLKNKKLEQRFPLLTAVYKICYAGKPADQLIQCLHDHPEHMDIEDCAKVIRTSEPKSRL
ncbi:glycerol-3-phosphate dehydrogenase [NAD(+)], cytoplasmic-like [Anneissia japonica]|uniref:glycerol-3-phosphate dehydrogenase [NAD(+)], cytoplasmic-like n=1 Tax=Anneissia japonica TaxID=1529436 RepID=UPI0014255501|nr:glycerol-3-phosphate dehydrogenase [NAD(+)], cytoplasmic-like [Anneissia japonica]